MNFHLNICNRQLDFESKPRPFSCFGICVDVPSVNRDVRKNMKKPSSRGHKGTMFFGSQVLKKPLKAPQTQAETPSWMAESLSRQAPTFRIRRRLLRLWPKAGVLEGVFFCFFLRFCFRCLFIWFYWCFRRCLFIRFYWCFRRCLFIWFYWCFRRWIFSYLGVCVDVCVFTILWTLDLVWLLKHFGQSKPITWNKFPNYHFLHLYRSINITFNKRFCTGFYPFFTRFLLVFTRFLLVFTCFLPVFLPRFLTSCPTRY